MNKAKYFTLGLLVAALVVLLYCPSTLELEHREPERITHERILFNADKLIEQLADEVVSDYDEAIMNALVKKNHKLAEGLTAEKYSKLARLRADQENLRTLQAKQAERIAAKYVPVPKN